MVLQNFEVQGTGFNPIKVANKKKKMNKIAVPCNHCNKPIVYAGSGTTSLANHLFTHEIQNPMANTKTNRMSIEEKESIETGCCIGEKE